MNAAFSCVQLSQRVLKFFGKPPLRRIRMITTARLCLAVAIQKCPVGRPPVAEPEVILPTDLVTQSFRRWWFPFGAVVFVFTGPPDRSHPISKAKLRCEGMRSMSVAGWQQVEPVLRMYVGSRFLVKYSAEVDDWQISVMSDLSDGIHILRKRVVSSVDVDL